MAQGLLKLESQDKTGQKTDWFEVLPAAVASDADRTSQLFIARFAKAVMFQVVLANEAGAAGFTPRILVPNGVAGGSDIILQSFTALTANGTVTLTLSPYTLTGFGTEFKLGLVPREWKFQLDYTTGTPATDSFDTQVFARYL
jgi:hypothetical protein